MKMNKIVASVSAAALAVSALATNAFAAGPYIVDKTHKEADHYDIVMKQEFTVKSEDPAAGTSATWGDYALLEKITAQINNTSTSKKYTVSGDLSFEQSFKVKKDASSEEITAKITGSVNLDDTVIKKNSNVKKELTPSAGGELAKLVDSTSLVTDKSGSGKLTLEIAFTIPRSELGTVINIADSTDTGNYWKDAFDGNGLLKGDDAEDFMDALEDEQLLATKTPLFTTSYTLTTPGNVTWNTDPATSTVTTSRWLITDFEVADKDVGKKLSNTFDEITDCTDLAKTKGFTFPALEELKNGGTVKVNFMEAVKPGEQYVVLAYFVNDDLNLKSTPQQYVVEGDSMTFKMPAGFTLDNAGKYAYPKLYLQAVEGWTTADKVELKSIEFSADGAADVAEATTAPTANEGDEQSNKPAATTEKPAAPAADGDKNQPTGVAIAIVPAIVAAAGVIISKKRK